MNRFSLYAITLGVAGILLFILSGVAGTQKGMVPLTTLQLTLFYVFSGTGILCFIVSFVLGILGFKKKEGHRRLRYTGLFFAPVVVIATVSFGLFISWAAFIA
ncbi:hypothetical protein [Bacillus ndiopicus]|uniref:hypothetical protein n=1 Tax=Bacillus ndiopicus TaxID=1347368 RepID=UPI0005A64848|nr:hypothetical protein [Bacillus ndiopicus]